VAFPVAGLGATLAALSFDIGTALLCCAAAGFGSGGFAAVAAAAGKERLAHPTMKIQCKYNLFSIVNSISRR